MQMQKLPLNHSFLRHFSPILNPVCSLIFLCFGRLNFSLPVKLNLISVVTLRGQKLKRLRSRLDEWEKFLNWPSSRINKNKNPKANNKIKIPKTKTENHSPSISQKIYPNILYVCFSNIDSRIKCISKLLFSSSWEV